MSFIRYNETTHQFEQSTDSGSNWANLFVRHDYTPTVEGDNSSTLTGVTAAGSYIYLGDMIHAEFELSFTVATANANTISATLAVTAGSTRSTATNFRVWKGTADGYAVALVGASDTKVWLLRGDSSQWASGTTYTCWFQINYFR